jgi:hypothetical protein
MDSGILYVVFNKWIRDTDTNEMPYKIGITRNSVEDRYYGLGLKMPGKFETKFAYKINDYSKAEQSIHTIFSKNCVNGEWFKLDVNELEFIKAICEKMDGILVTDEIESEIKCDTENLFSDNMENEDSFISKYDNKIDYLKELIRTIGMSTFVKYYKLFANNNYSVSDIIQNMKSNENYKTNSLKTKSSVGKRIFKEKLEKEALKIISNSNVIDNNIKEEAKKLLEMQA